MEESRPGRPARPRLSSSKSVFAREMERKLGLDGGEDGGGIEPLPLLLSPVRRIEIKAACKIYAHPALPG